MTEKKVNVKNLMMYDLDTKNTHTILDAKVIRSTLVNSRGEVKQRIIIEYD